MTSGFESSNHQVEPVDARAGVEQKTRSALTTLQGQFEKEGMFGQLSEAKDRFQQTVVDNMGEKIPDILNAIEKGKAMNFNVPKWLTAFLEYVAGLGETQAKVASKVFGKEIPLTSDADKKSMNEMNKEAQKRYPNDRLALNKFLTDVRNSLGGKTIATVDQLKAAANDYVAKVPYVAPPAQPASTVAAAPATAPATATTTPATTTQTPPKTA